MTTITNIELKTAEFNGLGEAAILFYGDAKKNNVKQGDVIGVETGIGNVSIITVFTVGSYANSDKFGREISSFILSEEN